MLAPSVRSVRPHRLASFALVVIAAAGCGAEEAARAADTRAVVIGIDGADWKVIDALAAQGQMPNLTRLRERGVWGPIETLNDIALSPVIWTSVATGKTAAKHGITWFMVDQPDGTRVPVRSHNRKAKAIWNILAESELVAGVLGWWATYPGRGRRSGRDRLRRARLPRLRRDARATGDDGSKTHPARSSPSSTR